jgi:hypothetical protein
MRSMREREDGDEASIRWSIVHHVIWKCCSRQRLLITELVGGVWFVGLVQGHKVSSVYQFSPTTFICSKDPPTTPKTLIHYLLTRSIHPTSDP